MRLPVGGRTGLLQRGTPSMQPSHSAVTETPTGAGAAAARWASRRTFIPGPPSIYEAIDGTQAVIDRWLPPGAPRRLLEAGCGSVGHFELRSSDHLVGIDISEKQLARNMALHERILGDLETYRLPTGAFDLVVCWYVLEHLRQPTSALERMAAALRPGGLLVLAQPSPHSPKGLLTRFTPHFFHVWVYRHLLGRKNAGRDDNPPFPTYLRWSIRASALRGFAARHGLECVHQLDFEDYNQRLVRTDRRFFRGCYTGLEGVLRTLSLGRYSVYRTDCVLVLRKPKIAA